MIEPASDAAKIEYRLLEFATRDDAEKALNDHVADGWQFVSYQAAGDSDAITHFLLLSRDSRRSERRMGFGR